MAFVTKRNATGQVIYIDGIEKHLLESLSRMLNFRWETKMHLPLILFLFIAHYNNNIM